MIPLPDYVKIKNRYCVAYGGDDRNVIKLISVAKSIIEKELPGIIIIPCFKENLLSSEISFEKINELVMDKSFGCVKFINDVEGATLLSAGLRR